MWLCNGVRCCPAGAQGPRPDHDRESHLRQLPACTSPTLPRPGPPLAQTAVLNAAMPGRPSPNFSFSSTSEQAAPLRVDGGLPASRAQPVRHGTKEEPGVFAGFVGDGVDKNKQFPQGRYLITKKLGSGTYGKVLGCTDKKYNLPVAIKIVRKDPPIYKEAAKKEIAGGTHVATVCMSFSASALACAAWRQAARNSRIAIQLCRWNCKHLARIFCSTRCIC